MKYFEQKIMFFVLIHLLISCGGGNDASTATATCSATSANGIKTCDHGLGGMIDQRIHTMDNGDLYMFGSHYVALSQTEGRYSPILAKSTDGGATWTTTGVAQMSSTVPTLYGTASATDGTNIVVTGGATSYENDATRTRPSYSAQVYFYSSGTNVWSYLASANSPIQRTNHAMAYSGDRTFFVSGGKQIQYDSSTHLQNNAIFFSKLKSTDGGLTWSLVTTSAVTQTNTLGNTGIYRHCMVANGNTLYLIGGKKAPITTDADGNSIGYSVSEYVATTIDKSTDGGLNWTTVNAQQPTAAIDTACAQINTTLYSTGGADG